MLYRFKIKVRSKSTPYASVPDMITMFYDEDFETVVKEMEKHDKKFGFSFMYNGNQYTCANLIITEETYTGVIIREWCYRDLFDIFGKRLKKV